MSLKDRENRILEYLSQNREVSVDELCEKFFVSVATMRRDLKALAEEGKIIRTHGGAFLSNSRKNQARNKFVKPTGAVMVNVPLAVMECVKGIHVTSSFSCCPFFSPDVSK